MEIKFERDLEVNESVDKLLGLKTFVVHASETVYYRKVIKAKDADDAWEVAKYQTEYLYEDIEDGDHFSISEIEEE